MEKKMLSFLTTPFPKHQVNLPLKTNFFGGQMSQKLVLKKIFGIPTSFWIFWARKSPIENHPSENESTRLRPFRDHHECSQVEGSRGKWLGVEAQLGSVRKTEGLLG